MEKEKRKTSARRFRQWRAESATRLFPLPVLLLSGGIIAAIIPPPSLSKLPLTQSGLRLIDIAYLNLVRCRTIDNSSPSTGMCATCKSTHFEHWLDWLKPRIVVCVGKWAHDRIRESLDDRRIAHGFVNRCRSLSTEERQANMQEIVKLLQTKKLAGGSIRPRKGAPKPVPVTNTKTRSTSVSPLKPEQVSTMNSETYFELFHELDFHDIELRKKLKHRKLLPTIYFNRQRGGFVYFTVYAKDLQLFKDTLWQLIGARQKKDDKPNLMTVLPRAGKERSAFSDILR